MIAPSDTGVAAPTPPKSFSPRGRRWFLSAALLLLVFGTGAVMTLLIVPSWLSGYAQRELSARTSRHFDGDVSVTSLDVSLFPRVRTAKTWGRQPVTLEGAEVWVMPSTSGRAAGYRAEVHRVLADLAASLGSSRSESAA